MATFSALRAASRPWMGPPRALAVRHYSPTNSPRLEHVSLGEFVSELAEDAVAASEGLLAGLHGGALGIHPPWWATIAIAALGLRIAVAPLRLYAAAKGARLGQAVAAALAAAPPPPAPLAHKEQARRALTEMHRQGGHPFYGLLPAALHVPLLLAVGGALRRMSSPPPHAVDGWEAGGLAFFEDLAAPSPALTAVVVAAHVLTIRWLFPPAQTGRRLYYAMQGLAVLSGGLLAGLPAVRSHVPGKVGNC